MSLYSSIFTPDREENPAVFFESRQMSYKDLSQQTDRAIAVLRQLNVQVGERVAILLNDSPEFISFFIAVCSLGAIAVPINMGLRPENQYEILDDCTASTAVIEADLCNRVATDWQARRSLRNLVVVERVDSKLEDFMQLKLAIEKENTLGIHSYNELSTVNNSQTPGLTIPDARKPSFILYTSGSTGEPKGAIHTIADIFYTNDAFCRQVLKLRTGDRLFSSSRLPFAYGFGNCFTFPLINGVTTVLCREKPTPGIIADLLRQAQPTIFFAVPVVYTSLLEYHTNRERLDCSSLRLCISAGEALPARLGEDWERTFGVPVLDGIGSTEMLHMWMSNQEGELRYGSSGKLLSGYEARLLDAEGQATPPGQEGNLWVRGASAAKGYWQRPEVSARTFVDGWVRTGDLYRCDVDGYWYHMGRSDDCFKSSGQWVSPVEVEDVLLRSDHASRAAVVEDFDENGLPCACAFVIKQRVESDSVTVEQELRQLCSQNLPRYKQPRRYHFVDELPYTVTGKIQRFKLRQQLRGRPTSKDEN